MPTFRRLLGFLRPYRGTWALSFSLALLAMLATVTSPWLVGRGIDRIRDGDRDGLRLLVLAIALLGLGRMLLTIGRRLVAGRVSLGVEQDLRDRLYGHLQALELGFFDRWQTGQLMSRATVDLGAVRFFLGYGLIFIVQALLTVVLATVAMLVQQPLLAVLALLPAPLIVVVGHRYGTRGRPAQQAAQQAVAELTAAAEESISGIRVVKAFAAEDRRRRAFEDTVEHAFQRQLDAVRIQSAFQPVIQFLPQISLAIVLLAGGRMVVDDTITVGAFAAFYVYVMMLIQPLRSLGVMLGLAQRATASGRRLFEILDRAPTIVAPTGPGLPRTLPPLPAGPDDPPRGELRFEGVALRYEGQRRPALQDVDLVVPAGQRMAIVGETGSGKTALVQLLPRLYDPTAGRVLLDGVDLRDLDPFALRHEIAVVDDDPFLFTDTVAANIAYAAPGATREQVVDAARLAQADGFVRELPDGYDTVVGERGLTLSGGQRQRLAIARALLAGRGRSGGAGRPNDAAGAAPRGAADAPPDGPTGVRVLVLDDATSNVDATTEQAIAAGLETAMAGRTTLVIAHRLSTVRLADRVVLLHDGRIAADGTHDELLAGSERYREVVARGLDGERLLTPATPCRVPLDEDEPLPTGGSTA
ncbi:ABC transporter ATP-binding protein [Patulibacter brassicae]|uniref:ABC transporter ATP-binding protein n=1 Tax=Patulibacter brassicae TaxID=1705717 RepID=A0ABU4VHW3_9ACTN|nr:ABC transporter ATP-binding protein [Patulibacter brassicae]MDX8150526.1 ABC transporter ATP-binding protein [Patulibacter brassicae]